MCSVHKYFKSFYLQSHESFIVMEDFVSLGCGGFLGKRICLLLKTLLNDFRIGYSTPCSYHSQIWRYPGQVLKVRNGAKAVPTQTDGWGMPANGAHWSWLRAQPARMPSSQGTHHTADEVCRLFFRNLLGGGRAGVLSTCIYNTPRLLYQCGQTLAGHSSTQHLAVLPKMTWFLLVSPFPDVLLWPLVITNERPLRRPTPLPAFSQRPRPWSSLPGGSLSFRPRSSQAPCWFPRPAA